VPETVAAIATSGRFRVITLCGTDRRLQRQLEQGGLGPALGWTDRVPQLLAAADVVVENAGGLSSLEAFASGLPIVTYRPIPGHGRDNAAEMARAGVTRLAVDDDDLVAAIDEFSRDTDARAAQLAA